MEAEGVRTETPKQVVGLYEAINQLDLDEERVESLNIEKRPDGALLVETFDKDGESLDATYVEKDGELI